jgi:hypothetical protein
MDGKELFYLTLNFNMMAVEVRSRVSLETSSPKMLFRTRMQGNPALGQYAVTGDGQRFLLLETAGTGTESETEQFHITLNWFTELLPKDGGTR